MTKYEVLEMLENIFNQAKYQVEDDLEPVFLAIIDVVEDEKLLEGERSCWPLSQ